MADVDLLAGVSPEATQALGNINQSLVQEAIAAAQIAAQREGQQLAADTQIQSQEMQLEGYNQLNEARQKQTETEIAGRKEIEAQNNEAAIKRDMANAAYAEDLMKKQMSLEQELREASAVAVKEATALGAKEAEGMKGTRDELRNRLQEVKRELNRYQVAEGVVSGWQNRTLDKVVDGTTRIFEAELNKVDKVLNDLNLAITANVGTTAKGLAQAKDDSRTSFWERIGAGLTNDIGRMAGEDDIPMEIGAVGAVTQAINKQMDWAKPGEKANIQDLRSKAEAFLTGAAAASSENATDGQLELMRASWLEYKNAGGDTEKMAIVINQLANGNALAPIQAQDLKEGAKEAFEAASNSFKNIDILAEAAALDGYSEPFFLFNTPEEREKKRKEMTAEVENAVVALGSLLVDDPDALTDILMQLPEEMRKTVMSKSLKQDLEGVIKLERVKLANDLAARGLQSVDPALLPLRLPELQIEQDLLNNQLTDLQEEGITAGNRIAADALLGEARGRGDVLDRAVGG